jgi:hypothetical protein
LLSCNHVLDEISIWSHVAPANARTADAIIKAPGAEYLGKNCLERDADSIRFDEDAVWSTERKVFARPKQPCTFRNQIPTFTEATARESAFLAKGNIVDKSSELTRSSCSGRAR